VSATADRLAARAEELPEGSVRRRVIEGARRFKAAWVDFGRLLAQVRHEELWREWGHPSFERYCAKELFIRPATAEKLTASYGFLERHEPALARSHAGDGKAPPFEVIEVLSRAEAAGRLSREGWRELREEVLDNPPTAAVMNRRLSERFGPPPPAPAPRKAERISRLAALARRLAAACEDDPAVPAPLARRAADLARDLEELGGGE
jgi:hypothetical protein